MSCLQTARDNKGIECQTEAGESRKPKGNIRVISSKKKSPKQKIAEKVIAPKQENVNQHKYWNFSVFWSIMAQKC